MHFGIVALEGYLWFQGYPKSLYFSDAANELGNLLVGYPFMSSQVGLEKRYPSLAWNVLVKNSSTNIYHADLRGPHQCQPPPPKKQGLIKGLLTIGFP